MAKKKKNNRNKKLNKDIIKIDSMPTGNKKTDEQNKKLELESKAKSFMDIIISEGDQFKDSLLPIWNKITDQLNQNFPAEWASAKEPWMVKIFLGIQSKTSEAAYASFMDMLYGRGDRWFGIEGTDQEDKKFVTDLTTLMVVLMRRGGFKIANEWALQEAIDLGDSYMKILVTNEKDKEGFIFDWRSCVNVGVDPEAIVKFRNAKYFYEPFIMQMSDILASDQYDDDAKDRLLIHFGNKKGSKKLKEDDMRFHLTAGKKILVSSQYNNVPMYEVYCLYPVEHERIVKDPDSGEEITTYYYQNEERVITFADQTIMMKNHDNPYAEKPAVKYKVKRNRNSPSGDGMLRKSITIQDTVNSLMSSGIDGVKMASSILMKHTKNAFHDSDFTLEPWSDVVMNEGEMNNAKFERPETSNINDVTKTYLILDEINQELTAINRSVDGSNTMKGEDTLGQSKIKLAQASKRIFSIVSNIATDSSLEVLRYMLRQMVNPNFIDMFQDLANEIIGFDEMPNPIALKLADMGLNSNTVKPIKIPKLDLSEIGKLDLDFTPVALTDFVKKEEEQRKIQLLIQTLVNRDPELARVFANKFNLDELAERWISDGDIRDYEALMSDPNQPDQVPLNQDQPGGGGSPGQNAQVHNPSQNAIVQPKGPQSPSAAKA